MLDRRQMLRASLVAAPALRGTRLSAVLAAFAGETRPPAEVARDEALWREVQTAFAVDRALVNLNNGGVAPTPTYALDAVKRHLDKTNELPAHHLWRVLEPEREGVRRRLARGWGVDAEEIALVRNASEGLQTCQLGIDLKAGDEVLATDQDYPRMLTTFEQRARREGIVPVTFPLPVPCEDPEEVVRLYAERLTPRTRMILVCHVINLTGQVLPVQRIAALGRERGIPVVVDGAHAFAQFDFSLAELGVDYYATSLHKWLCAPIGTGLLYVRRERIPGLWPLMAAPEARAGDVRKFEEIGTHPEAMTLAVAEALTFHQGIGAKNKEARLVHLRELWAARLLAHDRVRLNTPRTPGLAYGLANVHVEGFDQAALADWLWCEHKILVTPIQHPDALGLRVSPNVYTTPEEIERFCEAIEHALEHGIPD